MWQLVSTLLHMDLHEGTIVWVSEHMGVLLD
jgi:hypothetical protein